MEPHGNRSLFAYNLLGSAVGPKCHHQVLGPGGQWWAAPPKAGMVVATQGTSHKATKASSSLAPSLASLPWFTLLSFY